jgi:exopolysaccharide biosynthesis polyprenyl glycosylphosphotransferase
MIPGAQAAEPWAGKSSALEAGLRNTDSIPGLRREPPACGQHVALAGENGRLASRSEAQAVGGIWIQAIYALIDFGCVVLNGIVAFFLMHPTASIHHVMDSAYKEVLTHQPLSGYGGFLLLYSGLILLFCQGEDLYRTPRTRSVRKETLEVAKAVTFATVLVVAFIYLTGVNIVSRSMVEIGFVANIITFSAWRYAKRRVVIHRVERGIGARNALIVGAGEVGSALARQLEEDKLLGYRFRGFLDKNQAGNGLVLGSVEDFRQTTRAEFIDDVFITIPSDREVVKKIALEARNLGINVKIVPDLLDGLAWNVPLGHVGDFPVIDVCWKPIPEFSLLIKRAFDVCFSLMALTMALPFLVLMGIAIKLDSPGPVLYRSRRVGRKGHIFTCYKLRSMVINADEVKETLRHLNERKGPFFKIRNDPRLTQAGKWLRRYSLDELPQLWNVFKGDMSLVGPRPHPLDDYAQYSLDQLRRLEMRPGLTGLWQVEARQDPSFERNLALDLSYIKDWTFSLDLKLIVQTIPVVLKGSGQ